MVIFYKIVLVNGLVIITKKPWWDAWWSLRNNLSGWHDNHHQLVLTCHAEVVINQSGWDTTRRQQAVGTHGDIISRQTLTTRATPSMCRRRQLRVGRYSRVANSGTTTDFRTVRARSRIARSFSRGTVQRCSIRANDVLEVALSRWATGDLLLL